MVPVDDDEPRARVVDADEEAFWLGEDDDRPALDGVADVEGGLGGDGAPGGAGAGSALVARKPGERVNWTGNQDDEKTGHTPEVRVGVFCFFWGVCFFFEGGRRSHQRTPRREGGGHISACRGAQPICSPSSRAGALAPGPPRETLITRHVPPRVVHLNALCFIL